MAAVAYPIPHDRRAPQHVERPDLRLIQGGRGRGPGRSVYVRRRLVAALLVAALVGVSAWFLGSLGGEPLVASEPAQPAIGRTYVVQPGDTLWRIAQRVDPGGDVRRTVQQLAAANGGSGLQVGQHLVLP